MATARGGEDDVRRRHAAHAAAAAVPQVRELQVRLAGEGHDGVLLVAGQQAGAVAGGKPAAAVAVGASRGG